MMNYRKPLAILCVALVTALLGACAVSPPAPSDDIISRLAKDSQGR